MYLTVDSTEWPRPAGEALLLTLVVCWTSLSSAQVTEIIAAPAFSGERLVTHPTSDWITNGGNVYNQRYSPLDQINRANVADLRGVWRARPGGSGRTGEPSGSGSHLFHAVYLPR